MVNILIRVNASIMGHMCGVGLDRALAERVLSWHQLGFSSPSLGDFFCEILCQL